MTENGGIEAVASGDVLAEMPSMKVEEKTAENNGNDIETNIPHKDEQVKKATLNRSVSCGSILQGNGMNKIKNLSRRVSFPADDKLISGYNEPKNPWEHAHETTTEDLIQAYTQACQQWNVRPITKLLLQLQEITDFTVRANSLTLKGEKLEMRVIETLESIFKRVQFITIDLEATNLDEDAGASLFDMIEYYESAVNVLVGFNKNLGNRGWQAAAHMMRKMSCLRLFDGHSVPLSIQASPFVGRALRLSNTLVTLHLENAMLSGRPLLLIVAALRMNTTLRELFLADNRFSPLDALQIANLLKFNRILQLLDIRNNPIQDMGLGHLCAGLMAQSGTSSLNGPTGGLNTLVLWNNQISHEGMAKLAMSLRYTVSLSTLNLGQNVLGDDGILRLKEGLLQNHSLLRLGLVGTKLTDEGAVAIAEYLAESPRIIRLDLRNNDIRVAGLMALSLAFKINNSLLRLDIDKPSKKDSLKELAAKQESLLNDMISYAARNKQAALEKAQAAQQRQEEARRAEISQESGLRYMDMTNASTSTSPSPSVEQASLNNSNNQSPVLENKRQEFQDSNNQTSGRRIVTVTPDTDDTPEDSPEFLPRSSVSYHQVAPVMLSNSEIAKRAAAAKLHLVVERDGESLTPIQRLGAISKLIDDVSNGTTETARNPTQGSSSEGTNNTPTATLDKTSQNSSLTPGSSHEETPQTTSNQMTASTDDPNLPQDVSLSEQPKTETSERNCSPEMPTGGTKSERSNDNGMVSLPEASPNPSICETEKSELQTSSTDAPNSEPNSVTSVVEQQSGESTHDDVGAVMHEDKAQQSEIPDEVDREDKDAIMHGDLLSQTAIANAVKSETRQDTDSDSKYQNVNGLPPKPGSELHSEELICDGDNAAVRALVSMATDSKTDCPSSTYTQSTLTNPEQKDFDEGEAAIKALVSMSTDSKSEEQLTLKNEFAPFLTSGTPKSDNTHAPASESDNCVEDNDIETLVTGISKCELSTASQIHGNPIKDEQTASSSDQSQTHMSNNEQPAVTVATKQDIDDDADEESSGFSNAAEDNSIQSGDLSPMLEDDKGCSKLLTPDSGIVQFDNVGPNLTINTHGNDKTSPKGTDGLYSPNGRVGLGVEDRESSAFKSELGTSESSSNVPETGTSKPANMVLNFGQNINSETQKFEHGDFETDSTAQSDENYPKPVEDLTSEGAKGQSICKTRPKVLDSPCEIEVSHFDLNKFPSGDRTGFS